jgi:peroxiredoxin
MAQLRQEYDELKERNVEVVVVGPDSASAFRDHWQKNNLPFIGLPDPKHSVLKLYGQEIKIFKYGRMPAQVLIDKEGIARYVHYGQSMSDIPSSQAVLGALQQGRSQERSLEALHA